MGSKCVLGHEFMRDLTGKRDIQPPANVDLCQFLAVLVRLRCELDTLAVQVYLKAIPTAVA